MAVRVGRGRVGIGGRTPKFTGRNLPAFKVPSADYLNFSFCQLPPASASFRGLLRDMGNIPLLYFRDADNVVIGKGDIRQGPKADIHLKLEFPALIIPF